MSALPKFPAPSSLKGRCLLRFLLGWRFTSGPWHRWSGSYRLPAIVGQLRRDGWPVESELVTVKAPGKIPRYIKQARYFTPPGFVMKHPLEFRERADDFMGEVISYEVQFMEPLEQPDFK